jgi:hypothetical protein
MEDDGDEYLIWSNEHGAWWRPNSAGYTTHLVAAGQYSRDEALKICGLGRDGWHKVGAPDEIPVRVSDARECSMIFAQKQSV